MVTTRDHILDSLRTLKPELVSRFGVQTIGLFGSVARDDSNSLSDVDILVEFAKPVGIEFIDLGDYLESYLKRKVDLVSRNGIKLDYFKEIQNDILYV
ncbi:MAG: DNA polymerase subunit beta [Bacteroidetes bacterium]|nr:DNA polymerase subunit beta [Bacteroidota bacterium]